MTHKWGNWRGYVHPWDHGTAVGYSHGCRCDQCREAARIARARQREAVRVNQSPRRQEGWRGKAACADQPNELWFAFPGTDDHEKAREVCEVCPVKAECAEYARTHHEVGLWGGVWRGERYARQKSASGSTSTQETHDTVTTCHG